MSFLYQSAARLEHEKACHTRCYVCTKKNFRDIFPSIRLRFAARHCREFYRLFFICGVESRDWWAQYYGCNYQVRAQAVSSSHRIQVRGSVYHGFIHSSLGGLRGNHLCHLHCYIRRAGTWFRPVTVRALPYRYETSEQTRSRGCDRCRRIFFLEHISCHRC